MAGQASNVQSSLSMHSKQGTKSRNSQQVSIAQPSMHIYGQSQEHVQKSARGKVRQNA